MAAVEMFVHPFKEANPTMTLDETLKAAEAAHAEAIAKLTTVRGRIAAAQAAYDEAEAARGRLVAEASRGAEIAPKAMASANDGVATAEAARQFWAGAEAGAVAAVEAAAGPVLAAQNAIQEVKYARACAARIAAAEKLERLAGEFGAAYGEWIASADEIFATWPHGRALPHQIEQLRELRPGAWSLPKHIQEIGLPP